MMTPERRAKIDSLVAAHQSPCRASCDLEYELELLLALSDSVEEIDRLTADRDQLSNALDLAATELEAQTKEIDRLNKEIEAWKRSDECVRLVCEDAGIPTRFQPSGCPRDLDDAVKDFARENARLNKVVDQAIEWVGGIPDGSAKDYPELADALRENLSRKQLAAELERRSKE